MASKFIWWIVAFFLTVGLVVFGLGSGLNPLLAQMMGDRAMGYDMQIIHQLSANHQQIRRTVEQLPNGIRAVTYSDEPEVVTLLQAHVASMYQRLAEKHPFPMIRMIPTLPTLFRNSDRYQRQLTKLPKGVEVRETSNHSELATIIREHAHEVDGFVKTGMHSGMDGMMR